MRDYQRKKSSKYILPKTVYHQTLWRIRDYYRLKSIADKIVYDSANVIDGMPRSKRITDVVCQKVIKREKYMNDIFIIDKELRNIPEEYRKGVWENILKNKAYPKDADRSTYGRYKTKFIYCVAKSFELI